MNLDGLSLSPLVAELNARLAGARVDKISQPDNYTLLIWLRQPGEDVPLLISANPEYPRIHLAAAIPENPPVPSAFCMLLRKHLEDGRIAKVEQQGLDRVVTIHIDIRGERGRIVTKQLVLEIMGKHSNIILVQDGLITDAIKRVGYNISRFRQVLPHQPYLPPPGQARIDLTTVPAQEFVQTMRSQAIHLSLAKAIVETAMGIGPLSAKEMAWRAGLPVDMPSASLDDADAAALSEAITGIITPLSQSETEPTIVLTAAQNKLAGIAAFRLEHLSALPATRFPTMSAAVEFAASFKSIPENPIKTVYQKLVSGELNRLRRKEQTLTTELAAAEKADTYRQNGDILMANIYAIESGAELVSLPNLYADNPEAELLEIPLDPRLSALENAQRFYAKYNKLKRALDSLAIQLQECGEEIRYLESIAVSLEYAAGTREIEEIGQELVLAGYIKQKTKRRQDAPAAPLSATTPDGLPLLIGKNNRQNDLVTFKQSQPDDLWFHTKDIPGSHVILRCAGLEPSAAALNAAATLAAHFSKARQSANVPVDYTRRRYVKKPAGSKPGFVIYDRQKTLYVTPDEETVQQLLGATKDAVKK